MKAMKKIENFSGDVDVERWIDRFELAVKIDDLKKREAQVLSMHLSGAAYDTWKNLRSDQKEDATEIKTALRNAYGLRRSDAWHSALSTKAVMGESLDVVGEKIRKLVRVASSGANDSMSYISGLILLDSLPRDSLSGIKLFCTSAKSWIMIVFFRHQRRFGRIEQS